MLNLILGISLTLNAVLILVIFLYFKIKAFGLKKVQNDFMNKYFIKDDELDDMLNNL